MKVSMKWIKSSSEESHWRSMQLRRNYSVSVSGMSKRIPLGKFWRPGTMKLRWTNSPLMYCFFSLRICWGNAAPIVIGLQMITLFSLTLNWLLFRGCSLWELRKASLKIDWELCDLYDDLTPPYCSSSSLLSSSEWGASWLSSKADSSISGTTSRGPLTL